MSEDRRPVAADVAVPILRGKRPMIEAVDEGRPMGTNLRFPPEHTAPQARAGESEGAGS